MDKPSSKRRRIDAATALSKPFKSPLRRPAPTNTDDTPPESSPISDQPEPTITQVPPKRKRMLQKFPQFPLESWETTDPEILEVQKQYREIKSKVDALKEELEIATQALNLETNSRYIEIPTLITKWRLASQDAADEVFVGAKERFDRMGGMAAWRERPKRDSTHWEFDEETREWEHIDEYKGDDDYGAHNSLDHPLNKDNGEEESQDEVRVMISL